MTDSESDRLAPQRSATSREAGALALLLVVVLLATVGGVAARAMPPERSTRSSMPHSWASAEAGVTVVRADDGGTRPRHRAATRSSFQPFGLSAWIHGLPPIRGPTGSA